MPLVLHVVGHQHSNFGLMMVKWGTWIWNPVVVNQLTDRRFLKLNTNREYSADRFLLLLLVVVVLKPHLVDVFFLRTSLTSQYIWKKRKIFHILLITLYPNLSKKLSSLYLMNGQGLLLAECSLLCAVGNENLKLQNESSWDQYSKPCPID